MPSDYDQIRRDNIREYGEGTRHLAFLGRLYTERTHFLFELLQNAEDARATQIRFDLFPERLEVWHDGRPFDECDVRGICGVGEGTKADDLTKIGKFGIGFKSVYAYTAAPTIYSGDERFRIEHFVRPVAVEARSVLLPWTTLFIFPFTQHDVEPAAAHSEIRTALQGLTGRTLLFLRSIIAIEWMVDGEHAGAYLQQSEAIDGHAMLRRVTVIGEASGREEVEEWLVGERPVAFEEGALVRVEIAFLMRAEGPTGESQVVPVRQAPLVVFFPTEKETHLSFLIQGPYRTTPARDNIPHHDPANRLLIQETATLLVAMLHELRDLGLLSVRALEALPLRVRDFSAASMFRPIYDAVREALRNQPLLPTHDGRYVAARSARLAQSAALLDLLSPAQVRDLFGAEEVAAWLSGEITEARTRDLHLYLVGQAARYGSGYEAIEPLVEGIEVRPEMVIRSLTEPFLERQNDDWIIRLYAFLGEQRSQWRTAQERPILRLEDGRQVPPFRDDKRPNAFLPPEGETAFPIVRRAVAADEKAWQFLRALGLTEPDLIDEVLENILPKYESGAAIGPDEYRRDLATIRRALDEAPAQRRVDITERARVTPIAWAVNAATRQEAFVSPTTVYVESETLALYFATNEAAWFLGYDEPEIVALFRQLNAADQVRVYARSSPNGYLVVSSERGYHKRALNGFDPQCTVDGLQHALELITAEKAALIWNRVLIPNRQHIRGQVEFSTRQDYSNADRKEDWSPMGRLVTERAWLPDRQGSLRRPAELALDEIPDLFERDQDLARALNMPIQSLAVPEHTALAQLLAKRDISLEDLEFARAHREEIEELRRRKERGRSARSDQQAEETASPAFPLALAQTFSRLNTQELATEPEEPGLIINPSRRRERTRDEMAAVRANEPAADQRTKIVVRREWEPKDENVRVFLREQYGGRCQICDSTFPRRDGEPYFEGVYLAPHTFARWTDRAGNVLCLCATCSAKFQHGAVEANDIMEQINRFRTKVEGSMSTPVLRILLCNEPVVIRFSEQHLLDLQEMVRESS